MKSPFPGMDPYLEEHWRDVHHRFLTYASDELQRKLPGDLRARLEERVFVESENGGGRGVYPDVRVVEYPRGEQSTVAPGDSVNIAEPLVIRADDEPATEGFIEIVDVRSGNRVVTAIELLSTSNKFAGKGQDEYLKKQREYRRGGVSLVEIDLLRSGNRVLAVPASRIPPSHRTTYQVCVTRAWRPGDYEVYRAPLTEPLPTIRIPLRESDPDAPLELQALIDLCYLNGRYDDIDYRTGPDPPFLPEDSNWAAKLLTEKGVR